VSGFASGGAEETLEKRFAAVVPDQLERGIRKEEHTNRAGVSNS
jgi:hypothetical protein